MKANELTSTFYLPGGARLKTEAVKHRKLTGRPPAFLYRAMKQRRASELHCEGVAGS